MFRSCDLCVSIPPKESVSDFVGYLKGKSTLMIFDKHSELTSNWIISFWAIEYYVATVGNVTEEAIKRYIQEQQEDAKIEETRKQPLLEADGNSACDTCLLGAQVISPYRAKIKPPLEVVVDDLGRYNKMRRIRLLILTITICFSLSAFSYVSAKNSDKKLDTIEKSILNKYNAEKYQLPIKGIVPDKETAIKIATQIFKSTYGESINSFKTYSVKFDKKYQVWIISGKLPPTHIGGVPNIIMKKNDGKVLAIWHTK